MRALLCLNRTSVGIHIHTHCACWQSAPLAYCSEIIVARTQIIVLVQDVRIVQKNKTLCHDIFKNH